MTNQSNLSPSERQSRISDLVRSLGRVSVEELANVLDISRETIRRDLNRLSAMGIIRKVHGGAMRLSPDLEGSFRQRMAENVPAKLRIARLAASLFAAGDTLFIDTGSTTLYFAEALARHSGLTAITNSSAIARTLTKPDNTSRVVLIGGDYKHDNQETVGPIAIGHIRGFRTRHAVLTVAAVSQAGTLMDFNIDEAEVARAMIAQADQLTVLADASKFDRNALCEVCRFDRVDRIVTDREPPAAIRRGMEEAGTKLLIAPEAHG